MQAFPTQAFSEDGPNPWRGGDEADGLGGGGGGGRGRGRGCCGFKSLILTVFDSFWKMVCRLKALEVSEKCIIPLTKFKWVQSKV